MVSFEQARQSNANIANLPPGLVAVFMGATSGIGQQTLKQFAQHAPSSRIYSVARPSAADNHRKFLDTLPSNQDPGACTIVKADLSLVSEVGKLAEILEAGEDRVDILFMSAGFLPFDGHSLTTESLEPSMTTRYYSRLRAIQLLLPLLDRAIMPGGPRIISVLAGGREQPVNRSDLGLDRLENWSLGNSSLHVVAMGTLSLETLARQNPRLSIVHWDPGYVATRLLSLATEHGFKPPNITSVEDAGAIGAFLATSDRYSAQPVHAVPAPEDVGQAVRTPGGIFLVGPQGESVDNETRLTVMRQGGFPEEVWKFTQSVFAACSQ